MMTSNTLAVLDAISLPVLLIASDGKVLTINRRARQLLAGAEPKQVDDLLMDGADEFLRLARRNRNYSHLNQKLTYPLAGYYPATCRVSHQGEWKECYLLELYPRTLAVAGINHVSENLRQETRMRRSCVQAEETARCALSQASEDPLTGIANRRAFDQWFAELFHDAGVRQRAFSLLLIDLDYFKNVNDNHGHAAGDRVLCGVARLLVASLVRKGDRVARIGGEEFAVFLPDTDRTESEEVAWRLVQRIREHNQQPCVDGHWHPVTLSIGAATWWPNEGMTKEALMQKADESLYQAKHEGRDRAILA